MRGSNNGSNEITTGPGLVQTRLDGTDREEIGLGLVNVVWCAGTCAFNATFKTASANLRPGASPGLGKKLTGMDGSSRASSVFALDRKEAFSFANIPTPGHQPGNHFSRLAQTNHHSI